MKYLSVCSGIEAASVAWHPLGWEPLAFSEIEAFPRAVLAHHYPDVPVHGDFSKLRDHLWIEDADILVGGTPCQAFSVAGLRNSLSDERGNLSLEFVRLADAIDNIRSDRGRDPCVIVWENVPGVLSVKDNAFGCFLAALAGDAAPYDPPRGKWTNAGVVDGPARTVAWRILDAQYFGLAQRRRRVFVIASARKGFDPAAVLLEFEGVRRDTPPRREAGKAASGGATGRAGERSHWDGVEHPHPTLNQSHNTGGVGQSNQELFSQRGAYLVGDKQWPADIAPTLNAYFGEKQGLEDQHALGGGGLFVPCPIFATDGQANAAFAEDVALTLNATNEQPYIAAPHIVGASTAKGPEAMGAPEVDGNHYLAVTHSLRAEGFDAREDGTGRGTPLVPVQAFYSTESRCDNFPPPDVSPPLKVGSNGGGQPPAIAFSAKDHGGDASEELSPTLRAMPHDASHANGGGQMAVAFAHNIRDADTRHEMAYPLDLRNAGRDPDKWDSTNRQGLGLGEDGDPSPTISTAFVPGVAAYAFQPRIARNGRGDMGDLVNALNAQSGETGKGDAAPCVAYNVTANRGTERTGAYETPVHASLRARTPGQSEGSTTTVVQQHMAVRRLTPRECERLQGFPDNYTAIPWKKKPADQCPDGPRYKALGNSMAVPVMRWIGKRIAEALA